MPCLIKYHKLDLISNSEKIKCSQKIHMWTYLLKISWFTRALWRNTIKKKSLGKVRCSYKIRNLLCVPEIKVLFPVLLQTFCINLDNSGNLCLSSIPIKRWKNFLGSLRQKIISLRTTKLMLQESYELIFTLMYWYSRFPTGIEIYFHFGKHQDSSQRNITECKKVKRKTWKINLNGNNTIFEIEQSHLKLLSANDPF